MDAYAALNQSDLFRGLDRRAIREVAESAHWLSVRGGGYVYEVGDPGDALYILINGRLRITRPRIGLPDEFLSEVALGESVGEIAVITGEKRATSAMALRDSRLLQINKTAFENALRRFPEALLRVGRLIVQRLREDESTESRDSLRNARTYAILPAHAGVDIRAFTQAFAGQLAIAGATLWLDPDRVDTALGESSAEIPFEESEDNSRLTLWLNHIEDRYRYLLYQAGNKPDQWTRRCLRQADRVIVVAHAKQTPEDSANLTWLKEQPLSAPVELALIQPEDTAAEQAPATALVSALAWREQCGAGFHHNIGAGLNAADMGKMARLTSGRGLCLVFGGGGARGFAHLGLIRALQEKGLPIDAVGGTSMGAFVAALVAIGMDYPTMLKTMRNTFVDNNHLNDYSLSRISLINGKKFRGQLEKIFGDLRIEDLKLPFYCVSTSLTHGRAVVHDRGRLVDWIGTSMAVPGIAPPTVYRGELLVDGGLMHGVDFETMMDQGRGRVVLSDVSRARDLSMEGVAPDAPELLLDTDYKDRNLGIFKILFHSATLVDERKKQELDARADLIFHHPVGDLGMFDWEELDEIAYRAYHYADEVLDDYLQKNPDLHAMAKPPKDDSGNNPSHDGSDNEGDPQGNGNAKSSEVVA